MKRLFAVLVVFPLLTYAAQTPSVQRIFRPPRYTRGAANTAKNVQPIDGAAWIWMPGLSLPPLLSNDTRPSKDVLAANPAHFLKCRCTFNAIPGERFEIDVSADERFTLLLDGEFVANGPHRGLANHWNYQSYSIDLQPGSHVLEAVVTRLGPHAPLAQLSLGGGFILKASGSYDKLLTTGKAPWKVAELKNTRMTDKGFSGTFGVGSQCVVTGCDATQEEPGQGAWRDAAVVRTAVNDTNGISAGLIAQGWILYPSELPDQLHETKAPGGIVAVRHDSDFRGFWDAADAEGAGDVLKSFPCEIPSNTTVRLLWRLDDYYCAYPHLVVSGGKGSKVSWGWTESLVTKDGRKKSRDAFAGLQIRKAMVDDFLPDGRDHAFFTTPWWRCGKWISIRIETKDAPLVVERLAIDETRYPLAEDEASFACSDASIAAVEKLCRRGLEMCMHEMFFDCPFYEQQMYTGDSRVEYLVTGFASADSRLVRHAIDLFDFDRRENGMVPMNTPTRGTQESATYTMCWPLMLGDAARYRNDPAWLRAKVPGLVHTLAGLAQYKNADGLIRDLPGWLFIDWVRGTSGWRSGTAPDAHGLSAINNLFYLADLKAAADVFDALGMSAEAALYRAKAARLAAAIERTFWSEERGMLADDAAKKCFSEHANSLAIVFDVLPETKAEKAFEGLVNAPDLARTTVYFSHYLFEAYLKRGRTDLFLNRLDLWKSYLATGASTPFENPGNETVRSDCHAWGSHPILHLHRGIAGVDSAAPFFAEVRIAPKPGPLGWYRSKTPHPEGAIIQDMHFTDGRAHGTVTLPEGVSGVFSWNGRDIHLKSGVNTIVEGSPVKEAVK